MGQRSVFWALNPSGGFCSAWLGPEAGSGVRALRVAFQALEVTSWHFVSRGALSGCWLCWGLHCSHAGFLRRICVLVYTDGPFSVSFLRR